jgi:hypothetical protein
MYGLIPKTSRGFEPTIKVFGSCAPKQVNINRNRNFSSFYFYLVDHISASGFFKI